MRLFKVLAEAVAEMTRPLCLAATDPLVLEPEPTLAAGQRRLPSEPQVVLQAQQSQVQQTAPQEPQN